MTVSDESLMGNYEGIKFSLFLHVPVRPVADFGILSFPFFSASVLVFGTLEPTNDYSLQ